MVRVTSRHLNKHDIALLRRFAHFVLDKFVRQSTLSKTNIHIKIMSKAEISASEEYPEMEKSIALCSYEDTQNGKKKFTIVLVSSRLNNRAKKPWLRNKTLMRDLAHELVHVKQYLNNELFGYVSGDVRYKGEIFTTTHMNDEENYYDAPWEIEAYGREQGLYNLFVKILKEEVKAKA